MEPIYNSIGHRDITGLRASLQKSVLAFIAQHADVFEALSRTQTPFGGSFLVTNR
ncbi:hypothetical protein [Spirosoma sp.]|uniref:hypothetical protein n=1 Tax=Spirosoma sp. TaxID=1899569 RepID=UPI002626C0C0|nr:hypothetical protein [Spirosoma sp.]MCX6219000.1 hypothetical protein [Spirosoma sp.]